MTSTLKRSLLPLIAPVSTLEKSQKPTKSSQPTMKEMSKINWKNITARYRLVTKINRITYNALRTKITFTLKKLLSYPLKSESKTQLVSHPLEDTPSQPSRMAPRLISTNENVWAWTWKSSLPSINSIRAMFLLRNSANGNNKISLRKTTNV